MLFVNCHFHVDTLNPKDVKALLKILHSLELDMPKVQDAIQAALAQQDLVLAAAQTLTHLAQDVKDLLAQNDIAGAQDLLDKIQLNNTVLANAIVAGTEAAHLGDPTALVDAGLSGGAGAETASPTGTVETTENAEATQA